MLSLTVNARLKRVNSESFPTMLATHETLIDNIGDTDICAEKAH